MNESERVSVEQAAFAFFDFDDTIARGDSIVPYMLYCARRGFAPKMHVARAAVKYLTAMLGRCTLEEAKVFALSFLAGKTKEKTEAIAHAFWREVVMKRCWKPAVAEMEQLRAAGVRVVVVSASVTAYMDILPAYLPADDVIATVAGMDPDGRYNGLLGENCRGLQKPLRIAEFIAAKNLLVDYDATHTYGDSASDAPMLQLGAHPTLVNPGKKLKAAMPDARIVHWR